jgi:hypothetical protein
MGIWSGCGAGGRRKRRPQPDARVEDRRCLPTFPPRVWLRHVIYIARSRQSAPDGLHQDAGNVSCFFRSASETICRFLLRSVQGCATKVADAWAIFFWPRWGRVLRPDGPWRMKRKGARSQTYGDEPERRGARGGLGASVTG